MIFYKVEELGVEFWRGFKPLFEVPYTALVIGSGAFMFYIIMLGVRGA